LWRIGHKIREIKGSGVFFRSDSPIQNNKTVTGAFISFFAWMALLPGTAALICGGVLSGWSIVAGREELWKIGLPITIGGLIALLIGLMLQFVRLRHGNNHAAVKLYEIEERPSDLNSTSSIFKVVHDSSPAPFHTHLAGGAKSRLLLGDLKSQLDSLAREIES
jgi:hypothetical protein